MLLVAYYADILHPGVTVIVKEVRSGILVAGF